MKLVSIFAMAFAFQVTNVAYADDTAGSEEDTTPYECKCSFSKKTKKWLISAKWVNPYKGEILGTLSEEYANKTACEEAIKTECK